MVTQIQEDIVIARWEIRHIWSETLMVFFDKFSMQLLNTKMDFYKVWREMKKFGES